MYLLTFSYTGISKRFQFLLNEPMLTVIDPETLGNPPRKLASIFRPASGHFSVQNFASSDAVSGAVNLKTRRDGIVGIFLPPKNE